MQSLAFTNEEDRIFFFNFNFVGCPIIFAKPGNFPKTGTSKDAANHLCLCLKDKERSRREWSFEKENKSIPSPSC